MIIEFYVNGELVSIDNTKYSNKGHLYSLFPCVIDQLDSKNKNEGVIRIEVKWEPVCRGSK